jgi:hypothetical protein
VPTFFLDAYRRQFRIVLIPHRSGARREKRTNRGSVLEEREASHDLEVRDVAQADSELRERGPVAAELPLEPAE